MTSPDGKFFQAANPALQRQVPSTLFTSVISNNQHDVFDWLDQNNDPNAAHPTLGTLLHIACNHGHLDLAKVLVQRGADIFATRPDNLTPRDVARNKGYIEIADFLTEAMGMRAVPA